MKENPMSQNFAIQRACEIFSDLMSDEKEQVISSLQEQIVGLRLQTSNSEDEKLFVRNHIKDLDNKIQDLTENNDRLKRSRV